MDVFEEREKYILNSFVKDHSWEEKYRRIIHWGNQMNQTLPDSQKIDDLLVRGCQSKVWLLAVSENQKVIFKGDSDALITKGLVSLMIYFYSNSSPKDILKQPPSFINKLDLLNHLTPSRGNGLKALLLQIQNYSKAFLLLTNQT